MTAQEIASMASATMHANDECATTLGISIDEVKPGYAKLSMTIQKEYANGYGVCQGGIITTFADTAFAHACNSYNRSTVAQSLAVDFVRPGIVGETLVATANEIHRGKLIGIYHVEIRNLEDKLIAAVNGTSYEVGKPVFE